jgi:RNA polymerase sigma-70 factor (ECF subfamily)
LNGGSEGDHFEALTLPHLPRLLRIAARYGESEAEDWVQETYLRAWAAFDQLRERTALLPWLVRILRNVAFERRRSQSRRQKLVFITELEAAHEELVASDEPWPLDLLLARAETRRLRQALKSIPERFAEVVELHDLDGLTYREIAKLTSSPIGTVMSRISRGRRLLAAILALSATQEMGQGGLEEGLRSVA